MRIFQIVSPYNFSYFGSVLIYRLINFLNDLLLFTFPFLHLVHLLHSYLRLCLKLCRRYFQISFDCEWFLLIFIDIKIMWIYIILYITSVNGTLSELSCGLWVYYPKGVYHIVSSILFYELHILLRRNSHSLVLVKMYITTSCPIHACPSGIMKIITSSSPISRDYNKLILSWRFKLSTVNGLCNVLCFLFITFTNVCIFFF